MTFSSKIFPILFFFTAALLAAQEADPVATPASSVESISPAVADSSAASNKLSGNDNVTTVPLPENSSTPSTAVPSASESASPDAAVSAAPESSSSIMPTDPSMIPPPETAPANTESNAVTSSSPGEIEQATATPAMPSTESVEKKKQELKVRYYEVRTQAEKEADVAALKAKADQATTEEGKRQALRAYYELLFAKMKKLDSSISERCDLMQGAYLRRLEQTVIQPTIPLTASSPASK